MLLENLLLRIAFDSGHCAQRTDVERNGLVLVAEATPGKRFYCTVKVTVVIETGVGCAAVVP